LRCSLQAIAGGGVEAHEGEEQEPENDVDDISHGKAPPDLSRFDAPEARNGSIRNWPSRHKENVKTGAGRNPLNLLQQGRARFSGAAFEETERRAVKDGAFDERPLATESLTGIAAHERDEEGRRLIPPDQRAARAARAANQAASSNLTAMPMAATRCNGVPSMSAPSTPSISKSRPIIASAS